MTFLWSFGGFHSTIIFIVFCGTFQKSTGRLGQSELLSLSSFFLWTGRTGTQGASPFGRQKWCSWSEWSKCAPLPCHNQIRVNYKPDNDGAASDPLEETVGDASSYCVVPPPVKSKRTIWTAVVQYTSGGLTRTRTPLRKRTRLCACISSSILHWIGFGKNQCTDGSKETQCATCYFDESIYSDFVDSAVGAKPLPLCDPFAQGAMHLYKILGGVAGAVVLVLVLVWLIRVLCKTFRPRTNRTGTGHHRTAGGSSSRFGGASARAAWLFPTGDPEGPDSRDPLSRHRVPPLDNDSPPAYKDVVRSTPTVDRSSLPQFFRARHKSDSLTRLSVFCPVDPATPITRPSDRPTTSSNQNLADYTHASSTPPPPAYEEVIGRLRPVGVTPAQSAAVPVVGGPITTDTAVLPMSPDLESTGAQSETTIVH